MRGHAAADAEQLERHGGLAWAHREVVADRQDRDVRLVDAPDQLHVAEDARVAREVELRPVLDLDHEACRLAEIGAVVRARRMLRVGERDLDSVGLHCAALVRRVRDVLGEPLPGKPVSDLDDRDDVGIVLLREVEGAAHMVGVTMCDSDQVDPLGLLLSVRALRVLEPGVDIDALSAWCVEAEGGVA